MNDADVPNPDEGELATAARRILDLIAADPCDETLDDTPANFADAMRHLTDGYDIDVEDLIDTDETHTAPRIASINRPVVGLCATHMLPFSGYVSVTVASEELGAQMPSDRNIRAVTDALARRLQSPQEYVDAVRAAYATGSRRAAVVFMATDCVACGAARHTYCSGIAG